MTRGVPLSRFGQIRERLRRAYEAGRASVRSARVQAHAAREVPEPPLTPPLPTQQSAERASGERAGASYQDDLYVPRALRIAAAWSWRLLVVGVVGWALLRVIGAVRVVVIPLLIALLLSALLAPAVGWLLRARLPRSLATAVVLIGGLAAVIGTLTLVVSEFINGLPQLSEKTTAGIRQLQDWLKEGPLGLSDSQLNRYIDASERWIGQHTEALTSGAVATAASLFDALTGTLLVLFATFFFLRDGRRIWRFLVGLLPLNARWRVDDAGVAAWATLVAYVRATVLVAFIDAVGIGLVLVIFDIPFAFPLAALVFLGAFIPIVGATLSGTVAVLIALVDSGWVTALIILGAVIAVQQVEGHILQPLIMGRAVAIHPLGVIVSIAAGVVVAGVVGALIAVPLVAVANTAIRRLVSHQMPTTPSEVVVVGQEPPRSPAPPEQPRPS
ncbi:MAG TPA: AI-2E family transporter [Micromonospora sp.]